MPPELAISLASQLKALRWMPRVIISGRGEPTLHPELDVLIGAIRAGGPSAASSVTLMTGGAGLLERPGPAVRVVTYFEAGLSCIVLAEHTPERVIEDLHSARLHLEASGIDVRHRIRGLRKMDIGRRFHDRDRLILLPEKDGLGSEAQLGPRRATNLGGAAPHVDPSCLSSACGRPMTEMNILFDGTVTLCENDWFGVHTVGHVDGVGLEKTWRGEPMMAARRLLEHKMRHRLSPCSTCSDSSHENVRYAVPRGEGRPREPTLSDLEVIARQRETPSHTPPQNVLALFGR